MSGPRTKRQFAGAASDPAQRQITSFFTSTGATAASPAATPSSSSTLTINTATPRTFGAAAASDQANLISVGMRVRKAVPEGYKTGTYSSFSLWDDHHLDDDTMPAGETGRSRANAVSTPRELTPFCGIHRVGGLPASDYAGPGTYEIRAPDHDVPGLTLSQESAASHDSAGSGVTGAKTRKRFFVDDDEENPDVPDRLAVAHPWQDGEVSPRSLAPVGWPNNGRTMAVPRKGRLRGKLDGGPGLTTAGQENVMVLDGDFEEASFLDRQWEVEMSDA